MSTPVEQLKKWVSESSNIVFFGGAGISTESGINDFRGSDGLYKQQYNYPPETILSHSFFEHHTEEFYKFYREKMLCPEARPNRAHQALAAWEKAGKLRAVITQNIDGLHQFAGSQNVLELHGSVYRNHCIKCGKFFDLSAITSSKGVPYCECGGVIKPDVVLYEEMIDDKVLRSSVEAIAAAEILIVGGTSLTVYPASGLIRYYQGHKLVLINHSPTPMDNEADLLISDSLGKALGDI